MIFLFGLSISVCIFFVCLLYEKISILKGICLGISSYFFLYVLISAALFWINGFSIFRTVFFAFLISVVGTLVLWKKKNGKLEIFTYKKEWFILGLVLCIVLPFSLNKFEFFGMGQDQGVYQTKALELVNGNTNRVFDFEEYNILETEEQKVSYLSTLEGLLGYDLIEDQSFVLNVGQQGSAVAGIYHGIPTFPAILALFAQMFGMIHMQDCQTLFLLLTLMLVFYILENFKVGIQVQIVSILALGLSPEFIWISKSALTEAFLCLIVVSFIFLTTESNSQVSFLSWLSVIVFSFYHITIYTMMPLFCFIYWGEYIIHKNKKYLIIGNIVTVMYFAGFLFMLYIAPTYSYKNYVGPLTKIPFINENIWIFVICAGCLLAIIINIGLGFQANWIMNFTKICRTKVKWLTVYKFCLVVCLAVTVIVIVRNMLSIEYTLSNITWIAYAILSGLVLLPMIIIKSFSKKEIESSYFPLVTMFLYTIMIYSICMRQTTSFYYYSRYLAPYLAVICIFWAVLYSDLKIWKLVFVGGICIASYVKADIVLLKDVDDSRLEWNVLEDIMGIDEDENSAWIVSDSLNDLLFLPLNSKGSDVYNRWEDLNNELEFLDEKYSCIYYISDELTFNHIDDFEIEYRNNTIASEDAQSRLQRIFGYPVEFLKSYSTISVYKMISEKLIYDITDPSFEGAGFNNLEGNFAWTSEEAQIICYLKEKDYQAIIQQGASIPLDELGYDEFLLDIYINGTYLTTIAIDRENNGKLLVFNIPQNYINEGKNSITIKCDAWSPKEYGLNDSRRIGVGFQMLELKEMIN